MSNVISLPVLESARTQASNGPVGGEKAILPSPGPGLPPPPESKETTVGNYFIANYPPFGFWRPEQLPALERALDTPPAAGARMGVYAHIPFCRKRCHFCYFRVYTDKNSTQIRAYMDAMIEELARYGRRAFVGGRKPAFVYFGGGTPSYLSPEQFTYLAASMKAILPWDEAEEVTLEGEPGTLNERKLRAMLAAGITRLSLGIEHFDDRILEINGRAHRSKEILGAYGHARSLGFPQINVDLIAGMVEETDELWAQTLRRTIELGPDTVTIYQMEVPYNTTIYQRMKAEGELAAPVADWATKRRWVDEAFAALSRAGYTVTSATTAVRDPSRQRFVYRRGLFDGSDVVSVGVSAFGHIGGVNYQNQHDFQPYIDAVRDRPLPAFRAYALAKEENYIREFALQLKAGRVACEPFRTKFGADPRVQFAPALAALDARGLLARADEAIELTRAGLLQVDRLLLEFFRPEHRTGRFA